MWGQDRPIFLVDHEPVFGELSSQRYNGRINPGQPEQSSLQPYRGVMESVLTPSDRRSAYFFERATWDCSQELDLFENMIRSH